MTRITLTLFHDGLLRLHHDAGQTVTVLLVQRRADGDLQPAGPAPVKLVPTNAETTIGRVQTRDPTYRLESES